MTRFTRTLIFLFTVLLTGYLVLFPVAGTGNAATVSGIKVKINDVFLSLPQPPIRVGMTTLLPFRAIYEFLGAAISWDKNTSTVSASRGGIKVELDVKNGIAIINDEKVLLNVAPRIVNGTTMVPAWFFAESLGAQVDWDAEQQVLNISLAAVSGISLETRELTLELGETEMIEATVFPDNAVNKNIKWSSTFPSVASVYKASDAEAVVSAVNPGTAIIIAATEEGNYVATCRVTVNQPYTPVTGISLNRTTLTLLEGGRPTVLIAEITPGTATNQNIIWESSNKSIASVHKQTVDSGVVAPLKEGTAIITATTEDGEYVAVCTVTVLPIEDED
jgi:uncharacterized protein YjdB